MNTKAIQKEGITEQKQILDSTPIFKFHALTKTEQNVFTILFTAPHALNAFEIYRRVVYNSTKETSKDRGQVKSAQNEPLWREEDIIWSKAEFVKAISLYEKQTRIRIPTYSLFVRILNEFSSPPFNWINMRADALGKAKALYYLDDKMREIVKAEIMKPSI